MTEKPPVKTMEELDDLAEEVTPALDVLRRGIREWFTNAQGPPDHAIKDVHELDMAITGFYSALARMRSIL